MLFGITCVLCHPNFCKVRLKPDENVSMLYNPLRERWRTASYRVWVRVRVREGGGGLVSTHTCRVSGMRLNEGTRDFRARVSIRGESMLAAAEG